MRPSGVRALCFTAHGSGFAPRFRARRFPPRCRFLVMDCPTTLRLSRHVPASSFLQVPPPVRAGCGRLQSRVVRPTQRHQPAGWEEVEPSDHSYSHIHPKADGKVPLAQLSFTRTPSSVAVPSCCASQLETGGRLAQAIPPTTRTRTRTPGTIHRSALFIAPNSCCPYNDLGAQPKRRLS